MASSNSHEQGQGGGGQPRPLQMGAKGAYIVRLLMVGDSSCGKTSLVLRFDQNVFSTKFVTTIGVDYRDKMVKVRKEKKRKTLDLTFCKNTILLALFLWIFFFLHYLQYYLLICFVMTKALCFCGIVLL